MVVALSLDWNQFAIVLLAPLGEGQSIWLTDDGWNSNKSKFLSEDPTTDAGGSSTGPYETHMKHTASQEEPAGTVLTQADFPGADLTTFDAMSDQILVYRGSAPTTSGYEAPNGADPTFLCALDLSAGYSTPSCDFPSSKHPSVGWLEAPPHCNSKEDYKFWSNLPKVTEASPASCSVVVACVSRSAACMAGPECKDDRLGMDTQSS